MTAVDAWALPLVNQLIYALLTPFVFAFAVSHPVRRKDWLRDSVLHLPAAVAFSVSHVMLRGLVYPVYDLKMDRFAYAVWDPHTHVINFQWALLSRLFLYNVDGQIFSAYVPIVLIANASWYYLESRKRERRALQLETQLAQARLNVLKSQLQPHFLFNTMHSISALMLTDVHAADRMMTRLSDLLRMSLESGALQVTTLKRELEFVTVYLEIERIRFEDRLNVVIDIASETLDAEVPQLLLQPLVDNAVRHGISRRISGGEIRISAWRDAGNLFLQVRDNGPGFDDGAGGQTKPGLGLGATRERLMTLYGKDQSMDIRTAREGGVEVYVKIPFRTQAQSYDVVSEERISCR